MPFIPLGDRNPRVVIGHPYVTWGLIAACVLAFIVHSGLDPRTGHLVALRYGLIPATITGEAALSPEVAAIPPWATLITSMFLHASPTHLLFNMFVLFMFGSLLEQRIGTRRFLLVYFGTGIIAALAFAVVSIGSAVGASGAIMGVLGVTIMLFPDLKVFFLLVPYPITLRTAGIIIAAIDLLGFVGIGLSGVANIAHLGGLAAGLLYGYYLSQQKKSFQRKFHQPSRSSRSSSIEMSDEDIEEYLRKGRL